MNMIRKGQVQGAKRGDVRGQVALIAKLFGVAAELNQGNLSSSISPASSFLQHNRSVSRYSFSTLCLSENSVGD